MSKVCINSMEVQTVTLLYSVEETGLIFPVRYRTAKCTIVVGDNEMCIALRDVQIASVWHNGDGTDLKRAPFYRW